MNLSYSCGTLTIVLLIQDRKATEKKEEQDKAKEKQQEELSKQKQIEKVSQEIYQNHNVVSYSR